MVKEKNNKVVTKDIIIQHLQKTVIDLLDQNTVPRITISAKKALSPAQQEIEKQKRNREELNSALYLSMK